MRLGGFSLLVSLTTFLPVSWEWYVGIWQTLWGVDLIIVLHRGQQELGKMQSLSPPSVL